VLFLFLVVWASDIGAYMAGRALGGPKLWPAVSPNKTWSGAAGGLLAAILVALGTALVFTPGASTVAVVAVAALLGVASQAGDLLESAIKRHFDVKDSSRLIPGHGGLLDRLDGVLAAAPVAALLSFALGQGRVLWGW
jgi:phosphatidate cytidylyltransferase